MAEYLSPGVYVEEIDAGPKPIEGVSTSTAGAVGVTAFGPTSGKPVLVTSFAEFQRKFGGFLPDPDPSLITTWLNKDDGGKWWVSSPACGRPRWIGTPSRMSTSPRRRCRHRR